MTTESACSTLAASVQAWASAGAMDFSEDKCTVIGNHLRVDTTHDSWCCHRATQIQSRATTARSSDHPLLRPRPGAHKLPNVKQRRRMRKNITSEDEPEHSQHVALVELAAVHTLGFSDRGAKPAGGKKTPRPSTHTEVLDFGTAEGHVVQHHGRTKHRQDQADGGSAAFPRTRARNIFRDRLRLMMDWPCLPRPDASARLTRRSPFR